MRIPCWVWIPVLIVTSYLLSSFAAALAVGPVFGRLASGTLREANVTWQFARGTWLYVLSATALVTAIVATALAVRFMKRGMIRRAPGYVAVVIGIVASLTAIGCAVLSLLFGTLRG